MPFELTGFRSYEEACRACEIWATLRSNADLLAIASQLSWDRTASGRILRSDVDRMGLLKGDRLEPHAALADIGRL